MVTIKTDPASIDIELKDEKITNIKSSDMNKQLSVAKQPNGFPR